LGGNAQDGEDCDDLGGEGDGCTGEEFTGEDGDRVEPVEGFGFAAGGDAPSERRLVSCAGNER